MFSKVDIFDSTFSENTVKKSEGATAPLRSP